MTKYEKLAINIMKYLNKYDMFRDVLIYVNNKCIASNPVSRKDEYEKRETDNHIEYWVRKEPDPKKYIEYANPETITMSFEGPLYDAVNYGIGRGYKTEDEMQKIFAKYDLYFEFGYAWSLSGYPL